MPRIQHIVTWFLAFVLMAGSATSLTAASQTPSAEGSPSAEIDSGPKFVVRPHDGQDGAFFTVNAAAGSTTELTAVIGNAGSEPIDLRTFSSDAVVLVNGGFGVREEEEDRTGATTWVEWSADTFSFEPGEGIERTFTVTIPEDAEPGEYITGISVQTADPIEIEGSSLFNQVIRKAVAVFIIVEGETETSFELGEAQIVTTRGGSRLEVPVSNTGGVLVRPTGTVTLTNADGAEVFSADVMMGSVYAGMDTTLSIPLDAALAGQDYEVSLSVTDPASEVTASLDAQPVGFSGDIPEEAPLQIAEADIAPMPDGDDPVYANVDLTIENTGAQFTNANVILHVHHDGELVEDFTLGSNMTFGQGETVVSQRYIPANGFSSGEWTFSVSIETVSPQSNATTVVLDRMLDDSIEIP